MATKKQAAPVAKAAKVNTVVAKALLIKLEKEMQEKRKAEAERLQKEFDELPMVKALRLKTIEIEKLSLEREKLKDTVIKKLREKHKNVNIDAYNLGVRVRAKLFSVDEPDVISEIVLMAHSGKTLEQIKAEIAKTYFK